MLNVLAGTYMSVGKPMAAAVAACVVLGISGEMAAGQCRGTGSFQTAFQDALFCMTDEDIRSRIRVTFYE